MSDPEIIREMLKERQEVFDEDKQALSDAMFTKGLQNVYVADYRLDTTREEGELYAILEVHGAEERNKECRGAVYLKIPGGKSEDERRSRQRVRKFFAGLGFQNMNWEELPQTLEDIKEKIFEAYISPSRNSEDFVNCDPRRFVGGTTDFGNQNPF